SYAGDPKPRPRPRPQGRRNLACGWVFLHGKSLLADFGVAGQGAVGETRPPEAVAELVECLQHSCSEEDLHAGDGTHQQTDRVAGPDRLAAEDSGHEPGGEDPELGDGHADAAERPIRNWLAGRLGGDDAFEGVAVVVRPRPGGD